MKIVLTKCHKIKILSFLIWNTDLQQVLNILLEMVCQCTNWYKNCCLVHYYYIFCFFRCCCCCCCYQAYLCNYDEGDVNLSLRRGIRINEIRFRRNLLRKDCTISSIRGPELKLCVHTDTLLLGLILMPFLKVHFE